MANSGGHWNTLAECQKLTDATNIPGVIEEDIRRENPILRVPVVQAAGTGTQIQWLRESNTTEDDVAETGIGGILSWSESITYEQVTQDLKITYIQRKLDNFVEQIYGTYNNYERIVLKEMKKGLMRRLGDRFFYGDTTFGNAAQFDGLHALAATNTGTNLDIDEGDGALSLHNVRLVLDAMKYGCDVILVPPAIGRRFDELMEEVGLASYVGMVRLAKTQDSFGRPVLTYAGIPIVRTDYLVGEGANTGAGSNARTKTGSTYYSIFFVKFGRGGLGEGDPGLKYCFGNTDAVGDFYRLDYFEKMENFDAKGMRMINYGALLMPSSMAVGRIYDVTDATITV